MPMNSSGVVINVDEAVIRTAAIEIRMLVVDRRKVTLSLFRQFQQRAVIDPTTGQQKGLPWGLINYFWPGCDQLHDGSERHLHVLWQDGMELYRDCVYPERKGVSTNLMERSRKAQTNAWMMALLAARLDPGRFWMTPLPDGRYRILLKGDSRSWNLVTASELYDKTYQKHSIELLEWELGWKWDFRYPVDTSENAHIHREYYLRTWRAGRERGLQALRDKIDDPHKNAGVLELWERSFTLADLGAQLRERSVAVAEQWDRSFQALAALDQLFIAG